MSGYLKKFVGKYRIIADYDLRTNDFIKDSNGSTTNVDLDFDDFYIDCKNNIRIRHGYLSTMSCYIPSVQRGLDAVRKIFVDQCKDLLQTKSVNTKEEIGTKTIYMPTKEVVFSNVVLPEKENTKRNKYNDELIHKILLEKNILSDIDVMDGEVYLQFNKSLLDLVAKIVGAKTSGASILPTSVRNLPRGKYKIPEADLEEYTKLIAKLPAETQPLSQLKVNGLLVKSIIGGFDPIMQKKLGKKFDIKADRKQLGLKSKEYISYKGLWQEFIDYLQKEVRRYENQ